MNRVELTQLCDFMQNAEIEKCDWLLAGSNQIFILKMAHNAKVVKAIYKPRKGETPLWDFPGGTLYKREFAAFLVSTEMGYNFIPPTIIRKGPYGIGSVQLVVDVPMVVRESRNILVTVSELQKIVLFDYVVNNTDRKISHLMKDRSNNIWLVDHGLTFNSVPKLRTVLWEFAGQQIPEERLTDVKLLQCKLEQGGELRNKLLRLLDEEEMEALDFRIKSILEEAEFPSPVSQWSVPYPWY